MQGRVFEVGSHSLQFAALATIAPLSAAATRAGVLAITARHMAADLYIMARQEDQAEMYF